MKIIVISLIIFVTSFSILHSEDDSTKIVSEIRKILRQPEILSNYYKNDKDSIRRFFLSKKLKDSQYVEKIEKLISKNFTEDTTTLKFRILDNDEFIMNLLHSSTEIQNLNVSLVFSIVAIKGDFGLRFIYYKSDNSFNLIHINEFPELLYQLDDKFNIILHMPSLLVDLKKNFPDYYDEYYLSAEMQNQSYIQELINDIDKLCHDNCTDLILFIQNEDSIRDAKVIEKMKNPLKNQIKLIGYGFFIDQEKYYGNISFTFCKNSKKIYLYSIDCNIFRKEDN